MKLYLIRHGQSEGNARGVYCGQADYPLTEQGREEARSAAPLLQHITFDQVYASPLQRAVETAALAIPDYKAQIDERLKEISVGSLTGKPVKQTIKELGEPFAMHRKNWDFTSYGGENYAMMMDRASSFLRDVEKSGAQNVAAVCHAGMCYALLCAALGCEIDRYSVVLENAAIARLDYNGEGWFLLKWNINGRL